MLNQLKKLSPLQKITLLALVFLALVIRIIPILGNNFFFTMDQARDAVYVREIIERQQMIIKGPETSIPGIYAGPGWFYFLAFGYGLTFGHPVGGVLLLILVSIAASLIVFLFVHKYISKTMSWVGFLFLQIFWPFFETSRFAFNPFPTVLLAISLIVLTIYFLTGNKRAYYWGLIPVILCFNADLATAVVFFVFYVLIGLYGLITKKLSRINYLLAAFGLPAVFSLIIAKQAYSVFKNSAQIESAKGIFSGTAFLPMAKNFLQIISDSLIPQSLFVSLILLGVCVFAFGKQKNKNIYTGYFGLLTLLMFVISYVFFSTNKGWRDWHTIFLPTLLLLAVLALVANGNKKFAILVVGALVFSQLANFIPRYQNDLGRSSDPGKLNNQIQTVDWIYTNSEENGFNVYSYMTNSYFNYPYDYLFWWYGKKTYGHVPCHYEVYPKSHKYIYIPGGEFNYNTPTLGCDKLLFLIQEPIKDTDRYNKWLGNFENTKLIEKTTVGQITIEKREYIK